MAHQKVYFIQIYIQLLSTMPSILSDLQYASENSKIHPPPNHGITLGSQPHFMYLMVGCLCFGILLMLLNVYQLSSMNAGLAVGDPEFGTSRRPIVWMNAKNVRMWQQFSLQTRGS